MSKPTYLVKTTVIQSKATVEMRFQADSAYSALKRISHKDWSVFHQHPRKPIWVRRSTCNRYQQTIEQI